MNDFDVLVLNPFQLPSSKKLLSILNGVPLLEASYSEGYSASELSGSIRPKLTFLICSTSSDPETHKMIRSQLDQLPFCPIIAIVEDNDPLPNCPILQDYAWNVITTPFTEFDIVFHVRQYCSSKAASKYADTTLLLNSELAFENLIGNSIKTQELKKKILQVAAYDVNVLLQGETGSGKEVTAQLLHYLSKRSNGPFIAVNCGSIPGELFENEFFGHRKGAYTHADSSQEGLIYHAHQGTLFLDEIESLALSSQVKLLRFLESGYYRPLGQSATRNADVRIITATKVSLRELASKQLFREDLYYRLNIFPIHIAPLRERKDDILLLLEHFLRQFSTLFDKAIEGIEPAAALKLLHYDWPGNVRELQNLIRRLVITNTGEEIASDDIVFDAEENAADESSDQGRILPLKAAKQALLKDFESRYLRNLLRIKNGNISQAARLAEKERSEFCKLLKKYAIDPNQYRSPSPPVYMK